MVELFEAGNDLLSKLPPDIQAALKRKSSRDPNSRFPRKLHILLTYLSENPELEKEIGLSWINDNEFRMNKKNVSAVMGIKLNTMNVNLRDLGFEQLQHDKNGITHWKRAGFSRQSYIMDPTQETTHFPVEEPVARKRAPPKPKITMEAYTTTLHLEQVAAVDENNFYQTVCSLWAGIAGEAYSMPTEDFIRASANIFKQPEQPIENAIEVIRAIVAPNNPAEITQQDLYRFLAMFGPQQTAMLKIASLLICSNEGGNWLHFGPEPPGSTGFSGTFDLFVPNRLVIKQIDHSVRRLWNNPMIDAYGSYIVDETGAKYNSWEEYFKPRTLL